jgi:two-component system, sensor histidine kinase YesM
MADSLNASTASSIPPHPLAAPVNRIRRKLVAGSLRLRLMLYFLVVILLPLLTLGVLGPSLYAKSIERETTAHTIRMISQVNKNIELHVLEMERLIDLAAITEPVAGFLDRGYAFEEDRAEIDTTLSSIASTYPEIAGIAVVTERDEWAGYGFSPTTRDPLTEERWYAEARALPGVVRLIARPIGRNIRSTRRFGADEVVSVVKAMTGSADGRARGAILIDMTLSTIGELFTGTNIGKAGFLFIADSAGEMVYAPVNARVYRVPIEAGGDMESSAMISVANVSYQVLSQKSPYTGWRTVGVFSLSEALKEVSLIRYWSFIIGGLTMAFAIVAAYFFTTSVAKPVLALRALMKSVEHGDLSVRFEGARADELGELGRGFNEMIERIRSLIDQVYAEQMSKREAELRILQEQIKPHFLYNTLDTIQWMAQEHKVDEVVSMVGALTSLFRIGLSKGKELISLPEELEHVRSYLFIQKARYEEKFDYEVSVQEGLKGCRVMRLILQPLVENAIYHGIKERRGHGTLRVEARVEERGGAKDLVLSVRDDGVGMDEASLTRLRASLDDGSGPYLGGYGIRNVHERIRLTFGRPYGLSFSSVRGEGTEVVARHPFLDSED